MEKTNKVGFIEKVSYGLGDFGCSLIFASVSTWFLAFSESVFKIPLATAGMILFISKFLDGFCDVTLGFYIDSHCEKLKRLMRLGSYLIVAAIALILLNGLISTSSQAVRVIKAFIFFNFLNSFSYNLVNIPYSTLNLQMSDDPNERISLNCYRMFFSIFAMVLINVFTPILINNFGLIVSYSLLTILMFICITVMINSTRVRTNVSGEYRKTSVKLALKAIMTTRSAWYIFGIFFVVNMKLASSFATFGIYDSIMKTNYAGISTLFMMGPSLVLMFILPRVYKKFNKYVLLAIAFILNILCLRLNYSMTVISLIKGLFNGVTFSIMASLLYILFSDVSEEIHEQKGINVQGAFYGIAAVLTNLAQGLTALFISRIFSNGLSNNIIILDCVYLFAGSIFSILAWSHYKVQNLGKKYGN